MNLITQFFLVLFGAALAHWLVSKLLQQLIDKMNNSSGNVDGDVVRSIRKPVLALLWLMAGTWAYELISFKFELQTGVITDKFFFASLSVIVGWFMMRLIRNRERFHLNTQDGRYDQTAVILMAKIARLIVLVLVVISTMQTLGVDASGVIAFGGISGAALAFASRDLLSNFFGGVIVYLDKPFKVGDWVRSPDQEIEGTVEYIGWRVTVIRTFDKRPLYIPNGIFARIAVENPSRMTHRRLYETIGVRYADVNQMQNITEKVKSMLLKHPAIAADQTLMVNFDKFNASSLDFFIYAFTNTTVWTDFHDIKQEILLKVAAIIEEAGAEIAFPTRTVHLQKES